MADEKENKRKRKPVDCGGIPINTEEKREGEDSFIKQIYATDLLQAFDIPMGFYREHYKELEVGKDVVARMRWIGQDVGILMHVKIKETGATLYGGLGKQHQWEQFRKQNSIQLGWTLKFNLTKKGFDEETGSMCHYYLVSRVRSEKEKVDEADLVAREHWLEETRLGRLKAERESNRKNLADAKAEREKEEAEDQERSRKKKEEAELLKAQRVLDFQPKKPITDRWDIFKLSPKEKARRIREAGEMMNEEKRRIKAYCSKEAEARREQEKIDKDLEIVRQRLVIEQAREREFAKLVQDCKKKRKLEKKRAAQEVSLAASDKERLLSRQARESEDTNQLQERKVVRDKKRRVDQIRAGLEANEERNKSISDSLVAADQEREDKIAALTKARSEKRVASEISEDKGVALGEARSEKNVSVSDRPTENLAEDDDEVTRSSRIRQRLQQKKEEEKKKKKSEKKKHR